MVARKVGKILLYCCAGTLGLSLLLMLAVKLALDRAPQYQAEIKDWVHAQIGYRIAFAHVSPAFRWYGPELYFDRLELRSKDGERVLARAAGGRVAADIWQLIRTGKLLAGRVEFESPTLVITRTGPDQFSLASEIELTGGQAAWSTLTLDNLPSGTLAIRGGLITVEQWNAALPRLALRDVNLNIRRDGGGATLTFDAQLPAILGGEVGIDAAAHGHGLLSALDWTLLARTRNLSLAGWRALLPEYLSRLGSGTGGFEVAARGRGAQMTRADLDFGALDVMTQLTDEPGVKFEQVAGAITVTHAGDRWTLLGRRMRALRGGRRDPDSEFDVSWRGGDAGLLELHARASYLRAETLLPLAGLVPQKDLRERLQEVAPTGEWMNTHADLVRDHADDPWRLVVQAQFRGVGFAPAGRAPGLRGLNGSIAGTELGGRLDIESRSSVFAWPSQLPHPVDLQSFRTTLFWRRTADELLVATPAVEIKTRDAVLHARVAWRQPADGSSPLLTMATAVDGGKVADGYLYFPRGLIAPSALAWLNRALVAGHLSHADVVLQGPVRHFPFRDGTGTFLARARIDGMTLDYQEGWPRAEDVGLLAEFRNEGLTVQLQRARIGNLSVASGDARFVDFKTAELQLHATVNGDAADALGFLRATPLDAKADNAFSAAAAKGPMQANVDLFLPFKEFARRRVLVHAQLHGVSLNRSGSTLTASDLNGDADLDGVQVSRADVRGKALGGSFQMQARAPRNRAPTRTMLIFNGTLSGEALHAALALPANIPIGGSTDWHAVLRMSPEPERERSLRINSSLAGLELNLPEPLAKPAGQSLPTLLQIQWAASGLPQVRMSLGSVLRGQVTLDRGANGPQLGRAAVTFGASAEPAALSESQVVNTGGNIGRLDLSGWLRVYSPDKNSKPLASLLREAKFEVDELDYLGLAFRDVALDLTTGESGLRIGVGGPDVSGSISLPSAAEPSAPWKLEFERLRFTDSPGRDSPGRASSDASKDTANPRAIPAINLHAADVIWGDRQFGEVRATLVKLDDGVSLKQLVATGGTFTVNAKGEWRGKDAGIGRIQGTVSSTDVGTTLKQLGYAEVIEAKTGKLDFDMSWMGAPTEQALALATGHVQVALDKGQITGLKPGAGRVVGLASVAALPRRLTLDFSDLTDKGLAFDTARGDFDLHDGSAFTDNVLVKGPAAEIGLIGRVGLKSMDYDQTVVVTGHVSSSLPLAAFAGGPVLGAAVLVFTQVFKQPLKGLARGYYHITGNWDNPTVERIKSADAAAATAEAPK